MEQLQEIEGYKIKQTFTIGGKDIVFGVNPQHEHPYMVGIVSYDNPLDMSFFENGVAGHDYLDMVKKFTGHISAEVERLGNLRTMRKERGVSDEVLGVSDCIPNSRHTDYTGKVLVVDAQHLYPEYHSTAYQIAYATHGNGCRPDARGISVFTRNLYTGETERWSRAAILGVLRPERTPEWVRERLADILKEQPIQPKKHRPEKEYER